MKRKIILFDVTEAVDSQRRGIGVQMRSWLEMAPFVDYPDIQYLLASRAMPNQEPLGVNASNARTLIQEAANEEAFIDYLYGLKADLIFFPLASQKYVRDSSIKIVGVDYGMEDLYCRNYIVPQSVSEIIRSHEFVMQHYTGIVTVSKTSQKDLAWFSPEYKGKVQVVYPGSAKVAMAYEREMPGVLRDTPYFLIIGYEHKKNIMRITEAYDVFKKKTNSQTKLAIIGNPGFGGDEIDTHINNLSNKKDIVRLGYVPASLKQLLVQRCKALVALPIYEGFGISALEAIEAGKVVLVSDNGSLKEIVGSAGYLADPFSISSITKQFTVIDIRDDNPKKQHIPSRLAVFDQTVQAKKLLQYLSKLVA